MSQLLRKSISNIRDLVSGLSARLSMASISLEKPKSDIEFSESACSSCDEPCSIHEELPASMQKRIDQSNLYNSFKPYTQNILIPGGTGETWEEEVDSKESYCSVAKTNAADSSNGRIMILAYDNGEPQNAPSEPLKHPVYLFPKGIQFQFMTAPKMEQLAKWVATGDVSGEAPIDSVAVPFETLILVCSHRKRDKRCGVAGPLLIKEFKKQIDEQALWGCVVNGVSHIGGHKFAGNIIIYHKDARGEWVADWYGRVKACHVSTILNECVKSNRVLKDLWRGRMNANPKDPNLDW